MSTPTRLSTTPPRLSSPGQDRPAMTLGNHPPDSRGRSGRDVPAVRRGAAAQQDRHRHRRPEPAPTISIAQKYAEELKKEGLTVEVRETDGLGGKPAPAGGRRHRACPSPSFRAAWPAPKDRERISSALGSLYREPLWVFYRGEPPYRAPQSARGQAHRRRSDWQRHPRRSPCRLLAANGLPEAADPPRETRRRSWSTENGRRRGRRPCRKDELDAAFFVAAYRDRLHPAAS